MELQLIEAGAEEIKKQENALLIYTKPGNLEVVKNALINMGLEIESAELEYISKMPFKLGNDAAKKKMAQLFEALDNHDDVEDIYSNVEM